MGLRLGLPGLLLVTATGLWSPAAQAGLPLEQIELGAISETWRPWVDQVVAHSEPATGADGAMVSLVFETIDCEPRGEAWACRFGELPGPEGRAAGRWVVDRDQSWIDRLRFWRDLGTNTPSSGPGFEISKVEVFCRPSEPGDCRFLVRPSERRPTSARLSGGELGRRLATWVVAGWSEHAATTDVLPWLPAEVGCRRPQAGEPWSCRWSTNGGETVELELDSDESEPATLLLLLRRFAQSEDESGAIVGFETGDLRVECQHRAVAGDGFCQIRPGAGFGGEG